MITIIAAIDKNNGIGRGNELLCRIPEDMRRFKRLTMGHSIIMGRKTFESLPKGPLPGRRNIVLSRTMEAGEGYEVVGSLEEAAELVEGEDEAFVIGGGEVYRRAMPRAGRLEITFINHAFEADVFFPPIGDEWNKVSSEKIVAGEFEVEFCRYERRG